MVAAMTVKLIIAGILVAGAAIGVWRYGEGRYVSGTNDERHRWEVVIAETNTANAEADERAAKDKAAQESDWSAMAGSVRDHTFPPMTPVEIAKASTPESLRSEINRIKVGRP